MKTFLLVLFFSPLVSKGQKFALIDRNFYQPINLVDTFTMEQASKGQLSIYYKDIRSILEGMQWLVNYLNAPKINPVRSFVLKMGNSNCFVTARKNAGINSYHVVFNTEINNIKTSIILAANESTKRAIQRVTIFMDYLGNNASMVARKSIKPNSLFLFFAPCYMPQL